MICLWGCSGSNMSVPAANANRRSKAHLRDGQQSPFSSTHCRWHRGDQLPLWQSRDRAQEWCWAPAAPGHWGCRLGSLPALPIASSSQPPCNCGPKQLGVTGLLGWQGNGTHSASYCWWQACIRRQHMFWLGASSPPLPTLMTAQPLQSASSDCLIQTCTILQNPLMMSSQTLQRLFCGLMLVAAVSISDSVHVPAQTRHLPHASGPKPPSANLIF